MRKLMWFTIGFSVACALGTYAPSVWRYIALLLGGCAFTVAICFRHRYNLLQIAVVALGLMVGLSWYAAFRTFYLSPAINADGSKISLSAQIADYSIMTDYGTSVKAEISIDNRKYHTILYLKERNELEPGDWVSGDFKLRLTHEGLEGDTYHRGSGVFLLAYAQGQTTSAVSEQVPLRFYPAILRHKIVSRLEALFPDDVSFFPKALLLGDRSDVDYETNTAFKVSGISHIIAVSGLHVSILFSAIFLFTARKRNLTFWIGTPILLLFAAITGFTPSVTRACVMQILIMLADYILKEYDPPTALSASVLLMLIGNPISVSSVSLQLSAGCMVGIFLFSERIRTWICSIRFWKKWKGKSIKVRLRNWVASGVAITFSSMFFTTPLLAIYFGCVSLIGVVTNLLTLWVVSWIFYGILLICLVSLFWYQGAMALAWVVSWLVRYVLGVADVLSGIPLAAVYTKSRFIIGWLVLCYIMVMVYLLWIKRKPYVLICSILISLCTALVLSWTLPLTTRNRVTVLDVGQGQSIILQSHGKTFLVDCGGDRSENAADLAAETLLSMGIYRIDGVILTHYDGDHANGIAYLLGRIPTDQVYLPEPTEDEHIKQAVVDAAGDAVLFVQRDTILSWDDTTLSVFAPLANSDDNESGLTVLFSGENCDILITGDMGIAGENRLVLEKGIAQLTAMIAGHHGSLGSTGDGLLKVTQPQYVFISVGKDNSYGHPSQQLLDRLEKHGCTVYRTDQDGTIVFRR